MLIVKVLIVKILCLIFNDVDGYIIEENDGYKYLVLASTNKNKNEIKNQIESINGDKPIKYKKDLMKIRFDSDDNNLPLGKILKISVLIIVVKSVFQNNNKYYPQIHIHECASVDYKNIHSIYLFFRNFL